MLGVNTCNSKALCRELRYKTAQVSWPRREPQVRPGVCTFRKLPSPVNTLRYVPASLGRRSLDVLLFFSWIKSQSVTMCVFRGKDNHIKHIIQKCQMLSGGGGGIKRCTYTCRGNTWQSREAPLSVIISWFWHYKWLTDKQRWRHQQTTGTPA